MPDDLMTQLMTLRQRVADADRLRALADAKRSVAQQRYDELTAEIQALGVKPDKAEETLAKLEETLQGDLQAIDVELTKEMAAYQTILAEGK
jgi:hypothetical protein